MSAIKYFIYAYLQFIEQTKYICILGGRDQHARLRCTRLSSYIPGDSKFMLGASILSYIFIFIWFLKNLNRYIFEDHLHFEFHIPILFRVFRLL